MPWIQIYHIQITVCRKGLYQVLPFFTVPLINCFRRLEILWHILGRGVQWEMGSGRTPPHTHLAWAPASFTQMNREWEISTSSPWSPMTQFYTIPKAFCPSRAAGKREIINKRSFLQILFCAKLGFKLMIWVQHFLINLGIWKSALKCINKNLSPPSNMKM